ncbi:MAG: hypothetical protein PHR45_05410 [Muribaculaceae bacterium]|nr:hypothetical protein [Muribaculaceae bacterium]
MFDELPPINIQHSIPTLRGKYLVSIPEYLKFTVNTRGFVPLNLENKLGRSAISNNPTLGT